MGVSKDIKLLRKDEPRELLNRNPEEFQTKSNSKCQRVVSIVDNMI